MSWLSGSRCATRRKAALDHGVVSNFKALRVQQGPAGRFARLDSMTLDELTAGEVVVRVAYSGLNYKDALAVTGKGSIARGYPRTAGIDLAGVVETSADPAFRPGDRVLATGAGVGESLDGGLAERARLPAAALVPLPKGLSLLEAMALGTAGFTAALALRRLLENHQTPELGPIAVTGATGGVGGIALGLLKRAGFATTAITGKPDSAPYLRELGADEVVARESLASAGKPLETAVWGGAVDNLGGETLAYLTRTVRPWGNIACIGPRPVAGPQHHGHAADPARHQSSRHTLRESAARLAARRMGEAGRRMEAARHRAAHRARRHRPGRSASSL